MIKIKLYSIFLFNIIRYNPIKIVIGLSTILSIWFANSIPNEVIEHKITSGPIYSNSDTLYVGEFISNSKRSRPKYEIFKYSKNLIISNSIIYTEDMNPFIYWWALISIIVFFISIMLTIVISEEDWTDGSKPNWEFDLNFRRAKSNFIDCEKEGGMYYYTVRDRLVFESDRILREDDILYLNWSFNKLNYLPKFKTKRKWRESSIKELGL